MTALSPRTLFLLDEACRPLRLAFKSSVYHVGTSADGRQTFRDVDVRMILSDKKYKKLKKAIGTRGLTMLGLAIGEYLAKRTELPIDFQIQQQTAANLHHPNKHRNPLGLRELEHYVGDAPVPKKEKSK